MSVTLEPTAAAAGGCQAYALHIRGTAFLWHQARRARAAGVPPVPPAPAAAGTSDCGPLGGRR